MLKIGIDELGTEKQILFGYSYLIIPQKQATKLESGHGQLCSKYKLQGFHGKEFRSSHRDAYLEFLMLIKKCLIASPVSLFCVTIHTRQTNQELDDSFKQLFINSTKPSANFSDEDFRVLRSFVPYFLTLSRVCSDLDIGNESAIIEIDSDHMKNRLSEIKIVIQGKTLSGSWFLKTFYNKYKALLFPGAPEMSDDLSVMSDTKSPIIQAADVFANFILAHIHVKKGHNSKGRKEKSAILSEVFDDLVDFDAKTLENIIKVGDQDLDLTLSGGINFKYGVQ